MNYEIIIKGFIHEHVKSHWFEDLQMTQNEAHNTVLKGDFVDQAALYGVLRRIQDLGMELISVMPKSEESKNE